MSNLNDKFDVIILSLAVDDHTFKTTKSCVDSYISAADDLIERIYVVETNADFDKDYQQSKVEVIKPGGQFNYNKFFNIALSKCTSEFIIGPNNDLTIQPNCLQKLREQFNNNECISSLSPIDRKWHRHTKTYLPSEDKVYHGYEVSLHMFGCIFACRRSVFEKIGYLDEKFYFFYQDNDYAMCLQRCNLIHGVYTGARVSHQSGGTNTYAEDRLKYTSKNMNDQGNLLADKWNSEPFRSGGYQQFKQYL
jgi:hypothetical protein